MKEYFVKIASSLFKIISYILFVGAAFGLFRALKLDNSSSHSDDDTNSYLFRVLLAAGLALIGGLFWLISRYINIKFGGNGLTPIKYAAQRSLKKLYGKKSGWTPLMDSVNSGNSKIVEEILMNETDINRLHKNGWTALTKASDKGHISVVKLLLDHNADPNARLPGTWTPLMFACLNGNKDIVITLLNYGAKPLSYH